MPRDPSPAQKSASQANGTRSQGRPSTVAGPESSLDAEMDNLRARTLTLGHDVDLCAERCELWRQRYQPQSLIADHWATESARASLLSDQVAEFRQAQLEEQARREERRWQRQQRRKARYLTTKLKTRPDEAVEQLQSFGEGIVVLTDSFQRLIDEVHELGFLTPQVVTRGLEVCGCTEEPASIAHSPLAYMLLLNNLGAMPEVSAGDIERWLEPFRRPAPLRDLPRHELMGTNPQECRRRLLELLEAERARLEALGERVHYQVDIPSLADALNRVCILTDKSARRAAHAHTEARVTFRLSTNELVKALERDRKASVTGRSAAAGRAGTEAPAAEEAGTVAAGFESQETGRTDEEPRLPEAPDERQVSANCHPDELLAPKPETATDTAMVDHDESITYVDARVSLR
jgi:phosphoglycolate phosphatase-like HAD superfamily hydrolase